MKVSRHFQKLLSNKELALVEQSYGPPGNSWTLLLRRVHLLRKLRDKYRDLAKRQKLGLRGRGHQALVEAPVRTKEKAEVFGRALRRYERKLELLRGGS